MKIKAILEIDENKLMGSESSESPPETLEDAFLSEMGWVSDSGIFVESYQSLEDCHCDTLSRYLMIQNLCYELYKVDWKHSHMISKEREMDVIKNYYEEGIFFAYEGSFTSYLEEVGYDGELYVCFEEFMETEYQDEEYILLLLANDRLSKLYLEDLKRIQSEFKDRPDLF